MKRNVDDLAIFGGPSAFAHPLVVGRPNEIDRSRLFKRLNWAIDNSWLTNGGPLLIELEGRIADLAGVRHCIVTCNSTMALQLLAHTIGLTGEVVMPSLASIATPHSMRWIGLEPVFCEIDPRTGCLDVAAAEAAITGRTSAIIGVHAWGRPCAVHELEALAAKKGLSLIFDATHAFGCTASGRAIGGFGDAEVFSFHASMVVSSLEGGSIVTNDDELARRLRAFQNFGLGLKEGNHVGGTNAKMCEAYAAIGLTSLDAFAESIRRNQENYQAYRSELDGLAGVRLVRFPEQERSNYQHVIVEIDDSVTGIDRDLLMKLLWAEQVMVQPYFSPACHEQEPYRSRRPVDLPHTQRLAARVLALPTGTETGEEDIRRVSHLIQFVVSKGVEVTARWQRQMRHPVGEAVA